MFNAGLHFTVPFVDKIAYRHSLKETVIDVPIQVCITKDNISIEVDGVLYLQVRDPQKASYGINDYLFGTTQIAQTTMRSIIGKLDLDQTFEERENINSQILVAADKASDPWGIKVTRYEIKDIKPPQSIKEAMEKQMRAEREKRAVVAQSEGEKRSKINHAEGNMESRIAEAKAKVYEIQETAKATAEGIINIARAIDTEKGSDAVNLRVAEQYLKEFGNLAKVNNTMIIPSNMTDISSVIGTATSLVKNLSKKDLFVKDA
ncbi:MAG: Protein QmcA [Chlamydiia bacterium]|nr:Protein QmcA [Chlamydiia bacterium]MCH9615920.1 Protein QmcA [Chlamydiia bacterium]MCH9628677.1 Protein QmcA [Chlamydiia bacterium]